ncbi:MAG: hypothetical protein KBD17_00925 [Candidatus Pacebacteria bacterium]|nr:hypothetical protein [Candidatus Paceibacterota bacterium]
MWFLAQLIGLTVVYLVIAFAFNWAIGKAPIHKDTKGEWDNNQLFWFLFAASVITSLFAMFNWGPGLLLPNYPTPEQKGLIANAWEFLLKGDNSKPVPVSTDTQSWLEGTWFWWKAAFIYWMLTFFYSFYAFYDEIIAVIERVTKRAEVSTTATASHSTPHPTGHNNQHGNANSTPPAPSNELHKGFGARLLVEFLAEIAAEFVVKFVANKATKGTH